MPRKRLLLFFTCLFLGWTPLFSTPKIIIGVAGASGSGKTTLAKNIQKTFPESRILISQDSYYKNLSALDKKEHEKVNFDHPDSLDFTLLVAI